MVVVMVFTITCGPIADATLWGFPDVLTNMFLGSGGHDPFHVHDWST
jgi:hypothetical protein